MFNRKGQGSLEYLLLIGGAVLIAAIVIALVVSSGRGAGQQAQISAYCGTLTSLQACASGTARTPAGFTTAITPSINCVPVDKNGNTTALTVEFVSCRGLKA
jgi:uncharacterized protein (UPF0333 family)